jgi:hypothetical protein
MNYEQIDPIFYAWAERHGLQVHTNCKDEKVRMVRLHGEGKEFAGIGVGFYTYDETGRSHVLVEEGLFMVDVGIARRPSRNSRFEQLEASIQTLDNVLDQAYEKARSWLSGSS